MLIWLLASQMENRIPNDPSWIQKKICSTSEPDIKTLINYGFLEVASKTGLNLYLYVSNHSLAAEFANYFNPISQQSFYEGKTRDPKFGTKAKRPRSGKDVGNKLPRQEANLKHKSAYEILGISIEATSDEINAAYRHMAQMYHPDKVAHLAPEFREIAEDRMKEINAAYGELKKG